MDWVVVAAKLTHAAFGTSPLDFHLVTCACTSVQVVAFILPYDHKLDRSSFNSKPQRIQENCLAVSPLHGDGFSRPAFNRADREQQQF